MHIWNLNKYSNGIKEKGLLIEKDYVVEYT
jgi:hypothetical protein